MPDATLDDYNELAAAVMTAQHPILPQPHWGQDCAFIGFIIDRLVERESRRNFTLEERQLIVEALDDQVEIDYDDTWWGNDNAMISDLIDRIKAW